MLTLAQLSELHELIPYCTPSERAEINKLLRQEQREQTPPPQRQAELLAECEQNVWTWVNRFCWTYDPREADPEIPFDLFRRQEEFLDWLKAREAAQENGLAEKCRDVGFTWLCAAYALHGWLFRKGFKAGFGSRKLDLVDRIGDPDCIFEKIRFLLYRLPAWMLKARARGFNRRKHDGHRKLINPMLGGSITGEGGDNIGRGGRTTMYFVDEAAFLAHPKLIDAALSQNTRCRIDVSTPNGTGNSFYQKRFGGKVSVFTFRWYEDPRKDSAWYRRQKDQLDPVVLAQEVDIDYTASLEGIAIPAPWVKAAVNLNLPASGPLLAGLDVAEGGKNKNVLAGRRGPAVVAVESWSQMNTTQTAHKAADVAERLGARELHYDCIGVGAGVRGSFESSERTFRFTPNAVNGGAAPSDAVWPDGKTSKERFLNLRAELWWLMRARFEKAYEFVELGIRHPAEEMISIPNHGQLISELSLPLSFTTETGKTKIESKQDMAKRGVASPDFADALAYTFAPLPPAPKSTTVAARPLIFGLNRR